MGLRSTSCMLRSTRATPYRSWWNCSMCISNVFMLPSLKVSSIMMLGRITRSKLDVEIATSTRHLTPRIRGNTPVDPVGCDTRRLAICSLAHSSSMLAKAFTASSVFPLSKAFLADRVATSISTRVTMEEEGFREIMPGVLYKEIEPGTGPQAEYKQAVICSWEAVLLESGVVFERGVRKMLRVGDGDAPPGLELGLRQLRDGTKCVVRAEPRFAWGEAGRPASDRAGTLAVPPEASVEWRIEAHRLWYREGEGAPADQLKDARNKKELGNEHFFHENWRKAASNYQEILKNLNVWNFDEGSDERREAETIYVDCGNNVVFALMKMDEWIKAERASCDVLTVAPDNQKALYRAIQVSLHLSKYDEAKVAIKYALDQWPRSKDFRDLYEQLREHKRKYKERKAKMAATMSASLFKDDAPEEEEEDTPPDEARRCTIQ